MSKEIVNRAEKDNLWCQLQDHFKFEQENIQLKDVVYASVNRRIRSSTLEVFKQVITELYSDFKKMPDPRQIIAIFDKVESKNSRPIYGKSPKAKEEEIESFKESHLKLLKDNQDIFMKYFSNLDQYSIMLDAFEKGADCFIHDEDVRYSIPGIYLSEESKSFFGKDKDRYVIL